MNPYLLASGLLGSLRRNVPVPSASRPRIHASRPLATLFAVSFFVGLPSASAAMQATMTVQISPTSQKTEGTGWSLKSYGNTTTTPGLSYLAADHYYVGDFNGDGVDEVLTVDGTTGSSSKMSVMRYDETTRKWTKLWSINGDPGDGGIYSYRGNMIVGDFDGDSKDEILGVAPDSPSNVWITMFHFENGTWNWGWSNGGDESAGSGIYEYRNNLTAGSFMNDGRDEILGGNGWVTMFRFDGNDFIWTWSTGSAHGLLPYASSPCYAGDLDGDGQDDIIYVSASTGTWATSFYWTGLDWNWGWSNGVSTGTIAGLWMYPIQNDRLLVGNIDGDSNDELLFLQRKYNGQDALSMQFTLGYQPPAMTWSNKYDSPALAFNWSLSGGVNTNTEYYLMRTAPGQPKCLLARRKYQAGGFYAVGVLASVGPK